MTEAQQHRWCVAIMLFNALMLIGTLCYTQWLAQHQELSGPAFEATRPPIADWPTHGPREYYR